jgi:pimeloyl-ACP methyl ester carboxylesterase
VSAQTQYARTADGVHIAFQVIGDGPIDLVYIPGFLSHVEMGWQWPAIARHYRSLAALGRLIIFDKRGTGMSDRVAPQDVPDLETRIDDARAVMEAAGSERAVLIGVSEGAPMAALFAATHPDRTLGLVLVGGYACEVWSPDNPWGSTPEELAQAVRNVEQSWGTRDRAQLAADGLAPTEAKNPEFVEWFATLQRYAASPGAVVSLFEMDTKIDVRSVLPVIAVPTLVVHRVDEQNAAASRDLAQRIPGAKMIELPGPDHAPWSGSATEFIEAVTDFVADIEEDAEYDRVLATVLFTDLVGSTERLASVGDRAWRELLDRHHQVVRSQLARFRGREIDDAGDGFFAVFDGPARAVRCGRAVCDALRPLGLEARAGVHTGECELAGDAVRGIAVHTGARIMSLAGPSEVLVSRTVKDLVAGSGLEFADRGTHLLKGVPGEQALFALAG